MSNIIYYYYQNLSLFFIIFNIFPTGETQSLNPPDLLESNDSPFSK